MLTGFTPWGLLCSVICTLSCLLIKKLQTCWSKKGFFWSLLEHKVCDWNSKRHSDRNKTTTLERKLLVFQHLPDAVNEMNQLNFNKFRLCWERGLTHKQMCPLCLYLSTTYNAQVWELLPTNVMCVTAHGIPSLGFSPQRSTGNAKHTLLEMHEGYQSQDSYEAVRNLPRAIWKRI